MRHGGDTQSSLHAAGFGLWLKSKHTGRMGRQQIESGAKPYALLPTERIQRSYSLALPDVGITAILKGCVCATSTMNLAASQSCDHQKRIEQRKRGWHTQESALRGWRDEELSYPLQDRPSGPRRPRTCLSRESLLMQLQVLVDRAPGPVDPGAFNCYSLKVFLYQFQN